MFTDSKKYRLIFKIFSALCLIAVAVCIICDLAVCKRFTWSLFVLSAVPFAWLSVTPFLMMKQRRLEISLAAFTVILLPYLYLLARITGGIWFQPLALPIGIVGLLALWVTWAVLRVLKINKWYTAAILVFIYGVIVNAFSNGMTNAFLGQRLFTVGEIIGLVACTAVSVLLGLNGFDSKKA